VARELASSTAVSRAVLKGDKGASESSSSLIATVEDEIEGWEGIKNGRYCGK
jgi:hypothetical protein